MENYDQYKEGLYDENSPINQSEEHQQIESITDAFEIGEPDDFYNRVVEVQTYVNALRDYAKTNENIYLLRRLNSIYNKL